MDFIIVDELDFCYLRTKGNLEKIVSEFARFNLRLRSFSKIYLLFGAKELYKTERILRFR